MNHPSNASLSTSIADSMVETRRRQRATVTGGESTLDDDSDYTREFQSDDQKVCLWNLASKELNPRSLFPAFRILGLFPDTTTALAHAETLVAADPMCAVRMVSTHAWYTIPERDDPSVDYVSKVNRNLLHHQGMLQEHATEFQTRHDMLTKGRTPAIEQAQAAVEQAARDEMQREKRKAIYAAAVDEDEETVKKLQDQYATVMAEGAKKEMSAQVALQLKNAEGEGEGEEESKVGEGEGDGDAASYVDTHLVVPTPPETLNEGWKAAVGEMCGGKGGKMPPPLSRMVEVRNQRYAVVSVVNDYETNTGDAPLGKEPGVVVWAAFDTEAEALRYNKCVASKKLRDHDLAIVSMYEWLYPHMMNSDRVEQLYRNEELNNIMRHARTTSKQVREFEEMCDREEIEVPMMSVEPDLTKPAPVAWVPPVGSGLNGDE